jgi:DNA-binding NarL/FixJ family response regulator
MNGYLEARCPAGHKFKWLTGTPLVCPVCRLPIRGNGTQPIEVLTPREKEVLALLAEGMSNREIAEMLVIGECTVEHHAHNIFRKVGVRNRTQAAAYVLRQELS